MKVKVFGDSHSRIFKYLKPKNIEFDLKFISGATITGFGKRHSSLNVKNNILEFLRNNTIDYKFIILKFGQVDIDLGYYYKIVLKGLNLDYKKYIENLIDIKEKFLNELIKYDVKDKLIIFGINPPSLVDKKNCFIYTKKIIMVNELDESLKEILFNNIPTYEKRVEISRYYNQKTLELCKKMNIKYLEIFDEFFLKDNKTLNQEFTLDNDHHLKGICDGSNKELNKIYNNKLENFITTLH